MILVIGGGSRTGRELIRLLREASAPALIACRAPAALGWSTAVATTSAHVVPSSSPATASDSQWASRWARDSRQVAGRAGPRGVTF